MCKYNMYKKNLKKRKTALAECEVRKEIAGKKGDKNKYPYFPQRESIYLDVPHRRSKELQVMPFGLLSPKEGNPL